MLRDFLCEYRHKISCVLISLTLWVPPSFLWQCNVTSFMFTDRAKLCGRSWSIDTMEMWNLGRGEIVSQASAMAHSPLVCRENHLQVCRTMQCLCVSINVLIKIRRCWNDLLSKVGHCCYDLNTRHRQFKSSWNYLINSPKQMRLVIYG